MSRSENGAAGVVILGPGRSGTSSITRSFVAAGYFAGREGELLGPDKGNRLGHYEPLSVLRLNEELLAELGCSWWAGRPTPEKQLAQRGQFEPRIVATLEALLEVSEGRPLALKEPRINSLLPLWGPVLDGLLHPILALRDPVEIALSQARRDGTTPAHALAAWEVQMATLFAWLDGRRVTVVPFGELLLRPEMTIALVAEATAHLDPRRRRTVNAAAAKDALDSGERHEVGGASARDEYMTSHQQEIWRFLSSLPAGDVEVDVAPSLRSPSEASLIAIQKENELIDFATAHGHVATRLQEAGARLRETGERLTELDAELTRLREELGSTKAREAELRGTLAEAEARHAAEVKEIEDSISWRLTAPLRRVRRS